VDFNTFKTKVWDCGIVMDQTWHLQLVTAITRDVPSPSTGRTLRKLTFGDDWQDVPCEIKSGTFNATHLDMTSSHHPPNALYDVRNNQEDKSWSCAQTQVGQNMTGNRNTQNKATQNSPTEKVGVVFTYTDVRLTCTEEQVNNLFLCDLGNNLTSSSHGQPGFTVGDGNLRVIRTYVAKQKDNPKIQKSIKPICPFKLPMK
jgi:hypothetical protein